MLRRFVVGLTFLFSSIASAADIKIPELVQEQSEWCWAATSAAVISYYGPAVKQCEVAEYTRQVAPWHDFGQTDCCVDASKGCNFWNWSESPEGSILDILAHWGITAAVILGPITKEKVQQEIDAGRPFIFHWSGVEGHFLVGFGIDGDALSYLDPFFGFQTADYNTVLSAPSHTWDETLVMVTAPSCDGQPDGTLCTDANLCTGQDSCSNGVCVGEELVSCDSRPPCSETACNPKTGKCETQPAEDGAPCDDQDPCTEQDSCQQGICSGPAIQCPNEGSCHEAGSCDPSSGQCTAQPLPDGTPCDDGNACTSSDVCATGTCLGKQRVCDDGDDCTQEACDEQNGCEVIGNDCEDGGSDHEEGGCNQTGRTNDWPMIALLLLLLVLRDPFRASHRDPS